LIDVKYALVGNDEYIEIIVRPHVPSHYPDDKEPREQEEGYRIRLIPGEDEDVFHGDEVEEKESDYGHGKKKGEDKNITQEDKPVPAHDANDMLAFIDLDHCAEMR